MGADYQYCLKWKNFQSCITTAFESLRDDEDFVDITLACEGRQIKAHKMILSACSPYFQELLRVSLMFHVFFIILKFSRFNTLLISKNFNKHSSASPTG